MKHIYFILILCLFTGVVDSWAYEIKPSNLRIEKFVNAQGFYQNTVNAITSDKNGYLWFATPNGLIRYDGYSFEYHYHETENPESIPNNYITNLLNDSNGKLWIGTQRGLCLYFADKEQFFPVGNIDSSVSNIKEDSQKNIWIAEGSKLHIFKSDSIVYEKVNKVGEIDLSKSLGGNLIVDVVFLTDSTLIVATSTKLYNVIIKKTHEYSVAITSFQDDLNGYIISRIIKVENSLWVGTTQGLFQMFQENNHLITIKKYFDSNTGDLDGQCNILNIFLDAQKKIWIGTARNGILKYDNEKDDFISINYDSKNENGLTSNRINCMYEDVFGVLWIGTAQGGINKLDKNQKPFHNYAHNPYDDHSLSGNLINSICEDKEGRIWISIYENTISRTKNKISLLEGSMIRFERLEKQLGQLKKRNIVRLFQDSKGYWWIGTLDGVYFYDEVDDKIRQVQIKSDKNTIPLNAVRVIAQTDTHHMLIGGSTICILKDPWESILP